MNTKVDTEQVSLTTVISATFLVAGTIIGGGMIALPVATGISGFWPSTFFMFVCYLMMTFSALMFLEVSLWMKEGEHVISMTSKILGPLGKGVAWILYLFICYASLVAYTAGGGMHIAQGIDTFFNLNLTKGWGESLFVLLFGSILYFGTPIVGRVNSILFLGMIGAYFGLIGTGIHEIKPLHFNYINWAPAVLAIPIFLTSFSFQTMVPSLPPYLNRNAKKLRYAIVGGTTLSLLVYLVWQWMILGIVPVEGESGLAEAHRLGIPVTQYVAEHVSSSYVSTIVEYFAFFAVVTSFLGMGLGLYDFLSDGLKIKEKGVGKLTLALLIAVPTLFFASRFERVFYLALDATGGYGDAILNGMIPVLLIWVGRYKLGYGNKKPNFIEKKWFLSLVFTFFLCVFIFKLCIDLGIISQDLFLK